MQLNILIGTPAYNAMVSTDYLHSIIGFHQARFPITVMTIGNESLITRARNTIISYFYHSKEFTHLLFLDADIYLAAQDVLKMLQYDVPVIGAPVALKGVDKKGNPVSNVGKVFSKNGDLMTVEHIGTAVLLLQREPVEKYIPSFDRYASNPLSRGTKIDEEMFDVFKVGVVNGIYLSEDFYFCKQLRNFGFDINVEASVRTRHSGMYTFTL